MIHVHRAGASAELVLSEAALFGHHLWLHSRGLSDHGLDPLRDALARIVPEMTVRVV